MSMDYLEVALVQIKDRFCIQVKNAHGIKRPRILVLDKHCIKLIKRDGQKSNNCSFIFNDSKDGSIKKQYNLYYSSIKSINILKENKITLKTENGFETTFKLTKNEVCQTGRFLRKFYQKIFKVSQNTFKENLIPELITTNYKLPVSILGSLVLSAANRDYNMSKRFSESLEYFARLHGCEIKSEDLWCMEYLACKNSELSVSEIDLPSTSKPSFLTPLLVSCKSKLLSILNFNSVALSNQCLETLNELMKSENTIKIVRFTDCTFESSSSNLLVTVITECLQKDELAICSVQCVDDKLLKELALEVKSSTVKLSKLKLKKCGFTSSGLNVFFRALMSRSKELQLTELDLSNNQLNTTGTIVFKNFIKSLEKLQVLNLAGCEMEVDWVPEAIIDQNHKSLKEINLSKNFLNVNCPNKWSSIFTELTVLEYISVKECQGYYLVTNVEGLLKGLSVLKLEDFRSKISVDISGIDLTKRDKMVNIPAILPKLNFVTKLNLSYTKFADPLQFVQALEECCYLKELSMDGVHDKKSEISIQKQMAESLAQLIKSDQCNIEFLSLVDCQLRNNTLLLVRHLPENSSLKYLDLRGNEMGDNNALILSRIIQTCPNLEMLQFDRNNLTLKGINYVVEAVEKSYSELKLGVPIFDLSKYINEHKEQCEQLNERVQKLHTRTRFKSANDLISEWKNGICVRSNLLSLNQMCNCLELINTINDANIPQKEQKMNRKLSWSESQNKIKNLIGKFVDTAMESNDKFINNCKKAISTELKKSTEVHINSLYESLVHLAIESRLLQSGSKSFKHDELVNLRTEQITSELVNSVQEKLTSLMETYAGVISSKVNTCVFEMVVENLFDDLESTCNEVIELNSQTQLNYRQTIYSDVQEDSQSIHISPSSKGSKTFEDASIKPYPILNQLNSTEDQTERLTPSPKSDPELVKDLKSKKVIGENSGKTRLRNAETKNSNKPAISSPPDCKSEARSSKYLSKEPSTEDISLLTAKTPITAKTRKSIAFTKSSIISKERSSSEEEVPIIASEGVPSSKSDPIQPENTLICDYSPDKLIHHGLQRPKPTRKHAPVLNKPLTISETKATDDGDLFKTTISPEINDPSKQTEVETIENSPIDKTELAETDNTPNTEIMPPVTNITSRVERLGVALPGLRGHGSSSMLTELRMKQKQKKDSEILQPVDSAKGIEAIQSKRVPPDPISLQSTPSSKPALKRPK